jgi:hypothetical protein
VVAAVAVAVPLPGQELAERVARAPDGTVRLSFAARPGVCGHGRNIDVRRESARDGWESGCERGPVRVALDLQGGRVRAVRAYVGGRWRASEGRFTDLGQVRAAEAADYLLDLAASGRSLKGDPILPAVLADSVVVWRRLLAIARDDAVSRDIRKQAVFWVSQEAGEAATRGLAELAENEREDQEIRLHAVFALSQLRDGDGVPALIELARTNRDPAVRQRAIFWLGQSEDPRAIALFEELLTRRP